MKAWVATSCLLASAADGAETTNESISIGKSPRNQSYPRGSQQSAATSRLHLGVAASTPIDELRF